MVEETLEEAAENYANKWYESTGELSVFTAAVSKNSFKHGATWQQEKMYTYDELRKLAYNAFCLGQMDNPTENKFNGWIEQFKK